LHLRSRSADAARVQVVKYGPGPVDFDDGEWVGVELDKPTGKHNGTVQGKKYFECKAMHGMFVRPNDVQLYSDDVHAANTINSIGRKIASARATRHKVNQGSWNTLESKAEQNNLVRGAKFEEGKRALQREASLKEAALKSKKTLDPDDIVVEDTYEGPHLSFPLNLQDILKMLEHFKHGRKLHLKYTVALLNDIRVQLEAMKSCEDVALPDEYNGEKVTLTVIGDLHGQLQDLYSIFAINGLPSNNNWYLFNGDFVDRGERGVEVCMAIWGFSLLYPGCVHFNRGNHESRNQNSWMGFEEEVLTKYESKTDSSIGKKLFNLFSRVFDALPLCHLVENKIFIVHGGLTARYGITLQHLRGIVRKREPPLHGTGFEERLIEDLLWSDPRNIQGTQPSERGAGVEFGQEITNNFCAVNSVALIIRSHECVMEGFEVLHGGRLITLFSASRYCGTQTNKGAFLTLGKDLQPAIQQFYAHSLESADFGVTLDDSDKDRAKDSKTKEDKLEDDVVEKIVELVLDNKPDLYWYFTQHDTERCGKVSKAIWADALRNVLDIDIPFLNYQPRLADLEADGKINYANFLERYRLKMEDVSDDWMEGILSAICEKLFRAMGAGDINAAFRIFDTDGDNFIEYEEFMHKLKALDVGLTDKQIYELMRSVDVDNDSKIDFQEFAERFEVVFTRVQGGDVGDDWTNSSLARIGTAMYAKCEDLPQAFASFDADNSGEVSYEEFIQGVQSLNLEPSFRYLFECSLNSFAET
jgi:Ca2+-binding EF-hand superfamily protein/diadenosine tetraphosphatase ApaH/serine/threonine PP2A family protein phosphatase